MILDEIISFCLPYTITGKQRLQALIEAVTHVIENDIPGDLVECGVWRGGSVMAMALTLRELKAERTIHLYDTFNGMSEPTDADVSHAGMKAWDKYKKVALGKGSRWCNASLNEVQKNLTKTEYPLDLFIFHQGRVEDTLPLRAPDHIAVLRLDTDWYESTLHELTHLYPRLSSGGVLIVDDYGHWQGARKAVDEYFQTIPHAFKSVDYSCVVMRKSEVK